MKRSMEQEQKLRSKTKNEQRAKKNEQGAKKTVQKEQWVEN